MYAALEAVSMLRFREKKKSLKSQPLQARDNAWLKYYVQKIVEHYWDLDAGNGGGCSTLLSSFNYHAFPLLTCWPFGEHSLMRESCCSVPSNILCHSHL